MATSPSSKITDADVTRQLAEEIAQWAPGELDHLTLRQVLGLMFSLLSESERRAFLSRVHTDKGNGHYARSLVIGSTPVEIQVPRTRTGRFRPGLLPGPYQRGFSEETEALLWSLLLSCRSINAAKDALRQMGLPVSEKELETVAAELIEELELKNTAPIDCDLLALFMDGKYVEIKESERIRPYTVYVVIGLGRDGKKRTLACLPRPGRESLEEWKRLLRSLLERGLRRVLMVVHDDVPGLSPVTEGLFPKTDVQLCIVHLQRNAKRHLSKAAATEFTRRIRAIKAAWDPEMAAGQFEELCDLLQTEAPTFIAELRKKRDHYLAFVQYPDSIRRSLSTTNTVEVINKEIEKIRINSGGYFQSEATLKLKLGALTFGLEQGRWSSPAAAVGEALHQLNLMFEARFETEES